MITILTDAMVANGEALHAVDVVIMGSVVPPIEVYAGEHARLEMSPFGALEVRFA